MTGSLIIAVRLPISSTTSPQPYHTPDSQKNALKENNFHSVIKTKSPLLKKGH